MEMDASLIQFANWVCTNDNKLIVVFSIVNIVVFFAIIWIRHLAHKKIYPPNDKRYNVTANMNWSNKVIKKLVVYKKWLVLFYMLYANLTAIFPLLGILGTVAALVTYKSGDEMMENLMVALSTTLAGVVAAIIFKFLDSFISGGVDILIGDIDYISQNTDIKEEIEDEI